MFWKEKGKTEEGREGREANDRHVRRDRKEPVRKNDSVWILLLHQHYWSKIQPQREREIKDRGDTGVMSNDTVCSVKKNPYSRLIYCYIDDCIFYNASIGVTIKWWPVVRIGPASHLFVPIEHRKHWCSSSSLSVLYRLLHVNQPIGC